MSGSTGEAAAEGLVGKSLAGGRAQRTASVPQGQAARAGRSAPDGHCSRVLPAPLLNAVDADGT